MTRPIWRYAFVLASSLVVALLASGQQVVTGGPPPEIRNHIQALVKALNSGSSGEWEKMAQEHFSPGELKRHSVQERKQVFDNLRRDFGTISLAASRVRMNLFGFTLRVQLEQAESSSSRLSRMLRIGSMTWE